MVKEGCLNKVDEVYGFHNIPNFDEGDIRVCQDGFFAAVTDVKIRVIGKGGHGSTPYKLIDCISGANAIYKALHTIKSRNIDSKKNFAFTICMFNAGSTHNVFPDFAEMEGSIRTYDEPTRKRICERIERIAKSVGNAMECKVEVTLNYDYPSVCNHALETQHIKRLASKWFGP